MNSFISCPLRIRGFAHPKDQQQRQQKTQYSSPVLYKFHTINPRMISLYPRYTGSGLIYFRGIEKAIQEVLSLVYILYTVNSYLFYSQEIPDAYNWVQRIRPMGTADFPCKVKMSVLPHSTLLLLLELAPLAPRFRCLHKCCAISLASSRVFSK